MFFMSVCGRGVVGVSFMSKDKDVDGLEEITEGEYRMLMHSAIQDALSEAKSYMSQEAGIDEAYANGYGVRFYKRGNTVLYKLFKKPKVGF